MWRKLVRMYSTIDTPEFKPIDLIIIKKRLSDINRAIKNTKSISHLKSIRNQYHREILEMSQLFSDTTQMYRKNKLKNELKKYISEFHKIDDKKRKLIIRRYGYLTLLTKPIFTESTVSRIFMEDFMYRIEQRKLELFLKNIDIGKRMMIDKKNIVIIKNGNAEVIPTNFILPTLDLLGITKSLDISEVPVVIDIKKRQKKLKLTINEKLIENNTIRTKEKNIYLEIPEKIYKYSQ